MRVLLVVLFFVGLGAFLALLHFLAPISLTSDAAKVISTSILAFSGILIAVIGVLLAMYISQNLKGTEDGKDFQILLGILTLSMVMSFATGLLAFYSLANPDCMTLLAVLAKLFCAIIYMNAVIVSVTVVKIMR